jgi:hypothetical protein
VRYEHPLTHLGDTARQASKTHISNEYGDAVMRHQEAIDARIAEARARIRELQPKPAAVPLGSARLSSDIKNKAATAGKTATNKMFKEQGGAYGAKVSVMRDIAGRLRGDADFERLIRTSGHTNSYPGYDDPFESAVARLIQHWAGSSDGHNPWSNAMQRAVQEEFGLPVSTLDPLTRADAWGESASIYAEHGAGLRAFVRAMYENTQQAYRDAGVTHVRVYRGQGVPASASHLTTGANHDTTIQLQPASSFSTSFAVSQRFHGGMTIGAAVPVERIIGTAATGWGCLNEYEVVVLGADLGDTALIFKGYRGNEADFLAAFGL